MEGVIFLILFPFAASVLMALKRKSGLLRRCMLFTFAGIIIITSLWFAVTHYLNGPSEYFLATHAVDRIILAAEWMLVVLVTYYSIKFKKYYCIVLSAGQTALITWLELSGYTESLALSNHIRIDYLTTIMVLIIGVIGSLICIYAIGYMHDSTHHHTEYRDRRTFFFAMLFLLLGAMFGLVLSNNMIWMYFFWEITSICSFLLIGYNQSQEAVTNSFRALWMNLLGGVAFAVAICISVIHMGTADITGFVQVAVANQDGPSMLAVMMLAVAALTKSAQLPFSTWLLGAMVAPTPTSALLHSATMVKAGVYLLVRIAPAMSGNLIGLLVTMVGGFTFFAASLLAIGQSDGKKVLAYSTVSNLGLIAACAGIGRYEAVWAAILLMIFHAVSKSLMFLVVGATENSLGSRDIEAMHGLLVKLPGLAYVMIIGIMGMFLAPFGMLIAKWAALKAYIEAKNVILILFLVYGSATTLFYWAKWLGSVVNAPSYIKKVKNITKTSEWVSLISHAVMVVALCVSFPVVSNMVVLPYLREVFGSSHGEIIGSENILIIIMMLCLIVIVPLAVKILKKDDKVVPSYMAGVNLGDNHMFVDSFGQPKEAYMANWYLPDYLSEHRMLFPSQALAAAMIIILVCIGIGGAL